MTSRTLLLSTALLLTGIPAGAEVNVNVSIGVPAPVVVSRGPVISFETEPVFIGPARLGFYIAAGTPYDILFASDNFYLYYGNSWYRSASYRGPWVEVRYSKLPPGIRKHRIERIRAYRDEEYRNYRDNGQYRRKHFTGDRQWRDHRRDERRELREEHREDRRDQRGEDRGEHRGRGHRGHDD